MHHSGCACSAKGEWCVPSDAAVAAAVSLVQGIGVRSPKAALKRPSGDLPSEIALLHSNSIGFCVRHDPAVS